MHIHFKFHENPAHFFKKRQKSEFASMHPSDVTHLGGTMSDITEYSH